MAKTCIITGANSGIGFETTKALAAKGYMVVMVCRSRAKGEQALKELMDTNTSFQLDLHIADLSSQKQIRDLSKVLLKKYPVIDVLLNNAGTWFSKRTYTEDKIEMQFAVNHLAYFLLTHLLLPNLLKAKEGRIVNVASDSYINGKIRLNDLYLEKWYFGLNAYRQSKLANVLFTINLAEQLKSSTVTVNALQPGLVKTNMGHKNTIGLHSIAWWFRKQSGVTPEEGAQTSIYLASSDEVKGISGKYWDQCKQKPFGKVALDLDTNNKLWDICMELAHIEEYLPKQINS